MALARMARATLRASGKWAARAAVCAFGLAALLALDFARNEAAAQYRGRGYGACIIYSNHNFEGVSLAFEPGQEEPWYGSAWNDVVSSVRVEPGCQLEVWEHVTFAGVKAVISEDTAFVGRYWNDRISSSICRCDAGRRGGRDRDDGGFAGRPPGDRMAGRDARDAPRRLRSNDIACVAYARPGYDGAWRAFRDSGREATLGRRLREQVSSLRVASGCAALVDIGETFKLYIDRDTRRFPADIDNVAESIDCFCQ